MSTRDPWVKPHCAFCGLPPTDPMVPAHKLQQAQTRHMNLLLDLGRLINGEEPLNDFSEVNQLREMLRGNAGVPVLDGQGKPPADTDGGGS